MSARGRRTVDDYAMLVEVASAATIGGVVAAAVLAFDDGELRTVLILFVILVVVLLAVLTVATLQSVGTERTRPPFRPTPIRPANPQYQPPFQPQYQPPANPLPQSPARPAGPVNDTTPVGYDTAGPPKLGFRPAAPVDLAPPTRPEPDRRPPRNEEHSVPGARRGVTPVRRVVQCPHCGDFDVDLNRERESFTFNCRRCQTRWVWAPGRPWPTTVIRPSASAQPTARPTDSSGSTTGPV